MQCSAQLRRTAHFKTAWQARKLAREPVDAVGACTQQNSVIADVEQTDAGIQFGHGSLQIGVQQNLDHEGARYRGDTEGQMCRSLEIFRALERDVQYADMLHAVEPERTQPAPQMTPADHLPAPRAPGQAIGIEFAFAGDVL